MFKFVLLFVVLKIKTNTNSTVLKLVSSQTAKIPQIINISNTPNILKPNIISLPKPNVIIKNINTPTGSSLINATTTHQQIFHQIAKPAAQEPNKPAESKNENNLIPNCNQVDGTNDSLETNLSYSISNANSEPHHDLAINTKIYDALAVSNWHDVVITKDTTFLVNSYQLTSNSDVRISS